MIAVIETGGKQYKVKEGEVFQVEKIDGSVGAKVDFDKVLLIGEAGKVAVGQPYLEGKKVKAEILAQEKGAKVTIIKYKSKTRYRRKKGHRQLLTKVKILKIS